MATLVSRESSAKPIETQFVTLTWVGQRNHVLDGVTPDRQFTKAQMRKFFSHYESANKLRCKRNIDRYREPQQHTRKHTRVVVSPTTTLTILLAEREFLVACRLLVCFRHERPF